MANTLLSCSVDGHGPFATGNGAAYHATWCAQYRADNGIPDDAPGVRAPREAAEVSRDSILAKMAAKSEPTAPSVAGETLVLLPDGRTARIVA